MTETDPRTQLEEQLRAIETAATACDAGDPTATLRLAEALVAIFQPVGTAPTLLSRAGGTYARLASCVPKPPHPQQMFLPMVNVSVQMGPPNSGYVLQASTGPTGLSQTPRCSAPLGRASNFRQVQAPDWWKNEPVMVIDHSKFTRRDLAVCVATGENRPTREGRLLQILIALEYGVSLEVPWSETLSASLRQIAHELHGSPELQKLAGQSRR